MKKVNKLCSYSENVVSQNGEDGILKHIFEMIPNKNKWCVEFGAWDGKYLSNCYNLISNHNWKGLMIEANSNKFQELKQTYLNNTNVYLFNRFVDFEGTNTLDQILNETPIPKDFDLLSIDIDGNDFHIFDSIKRYSPKVVIIEFNPTIPSDIEFVQEKNMKINQGSSLLSICKLAESKGYALIATTTCNAIFVIKEYFGIFGIENNSPSVIWDTEMEAPRIFQLFDGTIVLSNNFELLWSGINVNILDLQKLPKELRMYCDAQSTTKVIHKYDVKDILKLFFKKIIGKIKL